MHKQFNLYRDKPFNQNNDHSGMDNRAIRNNSPSLLKHKMFKRTLKTVRRQLPRGIQNFESESEDIQQLTNYEDCIKSATECNKSINHDYQLQPKDLNNNRKNNDEGAIRIETLKSSSDVNKFAAKIDRLYQQYKLQQPSTAIHRKDNDTFDHYYMNFYSVVLNKPKKKMANPSYSPISSKISYYSSRNICEFKLYYNEDLCFVNQHVYEDKLRPVLKDDDCDTDNEEFKTANKKCRKDLIKGLSSITKKLTKNGKIGYDDNKTKTV